MSRHPKTDQLCEQIINDSPRVQVVKLVFHACDLEAQFLEAQRLITHDASVCTCEKCTESRNLKTKT